MSLSGLFLLLPPPPLPSCLRLPGKRARRVNNYRNDKALPSNQRPVVHSLAKRHDKIDRCHASEEKGGERESKEHHVGYRPQLSAPCAHISRALKAPLTRDPSGQQGGKGRETKRGRRAKREMVQPRGIMTQVDGNTRGVALAEFHNFRASEACDLHDTRDARR